MVLQFLRHLLPVVDPQTELPAAGMIINKVTSRLDFFFPFRQHAPSLQNARREIYADISRLASDDGVGFFNILAFRGVFFFWIAICTIGTVPVV